MTSPRPGSLGVYHVLGLIGRGGMAKVYRAQDTRTGQMVALKVLTMPAGVNDEDENAMFLAFEREIMAMRQVSHPYIVPLLDYKLNPEQSYLVMPYFEGGSVADRLQSGLYTPQQAAQLLAHLAFALDYAHSRGYLHRDIKPSNLLLDNKGQTYLSDFGLARPGGVGRPTYGTAHYMSPELAAGAVADARTDVYALGVSLYELLAGHRPFEADDALTLENLHRRAYPPRLSQLNPSVPSALDGPALQALAKAPAERYATAGEFARRFSEAVTTLPVEMQTQPAPIIPRPPIVLAPVKSPTGQGALPRDGKESPTLPKKPADFGRSTGTLSRIPPAPPPPQKPRRTQQQRLIRILLLMVLVLVLLIVALLINLLLR